jgi:hypothetical protein
MQLAHIAHYNNPPTQQPGVKYPQDALRFDVADILRKHIGAYKKTHRLSYAQHKAVSAILNCRTPAMGGVVKMCDVCKNWEFHYKA